MVRIYDENMKEVFMPKDEDLHYGSYPLELTLSSIQTDKSGRKTIPVGRSASLRVFIIASRHTDMDLKIGRIFEFFRSLEAFYVAKENEPFKLLKVEVNSEYTPDIGNTALTEFEIPLTVIKPFYRQSLHTTADIDSEGVRWNDKWGYGMGLSAEKEQWKYSFEPKPTSIILTSDLFEQGNIHNSGGHNLNTVLTHVRTIDNHIVAKGTQYNIKLDESSGNADYVRILHYNADGSFISNDAGMTVVNGNGTSEYTFTALGERLRLVIYPYGNNQVLASDIGTKTKINIAGYVQINHSFKFYNAGTEALKLIQQKESVVAVNIKSSAEWLEIFDGDKAFRLNKAVKNGDVLELKGHQILLNGRNVAGVTNRTFLTVKKGWNEWQIRGITNFEFDIDFRFLYD